jgi:hypothetical protein
MLLQMYAAFGKASNVSHNLIVKKLITGIGIDCNVAYRVNEESIVVYCLMIN